MMTKGILTVAACATLLSAGTTLWVQPAGALDTCNARINPIVGTIEVYAQNVSGTLLWGNQSGGEIYPFKNAATCVTGTPLAAKQCELGAPHSPLAITPPPLCTLYLKDGAGTCSAFIRGCTPGTRPLVELPGRFVDNGDGTITDTKTGLMWEMKNTGPPGDFTNPEYDNNRYTWSANAPLADGTIFTDFLLRINGFLCSGPCTGLAGHSDWRLPTVGELQTLVDKNAPSCSDPFYPECINPVFGSTMPFYWSSSTFDSTPPPDAAWFVDFTTGKGSATYQGKANYSWVRAVRGGS